MKKSTLVFAGVMLLFIPVLSYSIATYFAVSIGENESNAKIEVTSKYGDLKSKIRENLDYHLISSFLGLDFSDTKVNDQSERVRLADANIDFIRINSVSDSLKERIDGKQVFAAEYANGQVRSCLGFSNIDGTTYIQTVGPGNEPILSPIKNADNQIVSIWAANRRHVIIKLGDTRFKINSLWHSFGVTEPYSTVSKNFRLTNLSNTPIQVEVLFTSCGCTVADIERGKLKKNESCEIKTAVDTYNKINIAQNIRLRATDLVSKETTEFVIYLFANQKQVSSLKPLFIDFGEVEIDSSDTTRKVRLSQTEIDNFEIKKINTSGFPLETSFTKTNNRDYIIRLNAQHKTNTPGEKRGILKIITSSRFNSIFTVPYVIRFKSNFTAIPSVASFGLVEPGEVRTRKIVFHSNVEDEFTIELASSTEKCKVEIDNITSSVTIAPMFSDAGSYNEMIQFIIRSEKHPEVIIPIKCIAFVKQN